MFTSSIIRHKGEIRGPTLKANLNLSRFPLFFILLFTTVSVGSTNLTLLPRHENNPESFKLFCRTQYYFPLFSFLRFHRLKQKLITVSVKAWNVIKSINSFNRSLLCINFQYTFYFCDSISFLKKNKIK